MAFHDLKKSILCPSNVKVMAIIVCQLKNKRILSFKMLNDVHYENEKYLLLQEI